MMMIIIYVLVTVLYLNRKKGPFARLAKVSL